ncbi:MAG: PHP domain-containing protein, partial [Ardenticatenaceae bacterium]
MTVRYDLHVHTFRSADSLSSYEGIIRRVRRRGLTGIAVTDHNTIRGALELAEIAPFPVIMAEEIRTREGEIIGYFLQEEIPRGLGLEETIGLVHAQGGVVSVPHPLDRVRAASAIGEAALLRVIGLIDLIEGYNARCVYPADNLRAQQIARQHGKPLTAGSDAHIPWEIGRGYVELPAFDSPDQFVANLRAATVAGSARGGWVSFFSLFA